MVQAFRLSLQDVLEMANELSREDKTVLITSLGEQLAADFTPDEVEDIKHTVAEADAEFERGEGIPAAEFYKHLGL